ncbi:parasitophorous vacuolar protein 2, putative [Plasmodium vivax]|uniref:Parasitophorous vacuolar protein 2, putative n=1 Tax=Plasmodium vivax TaxID=5855 RepID=A0A565A2N1_PLAVI|nr:parasitophorous vacuolar protein 2, putative [Plasmodium vivax]
MVPPARVAALLLLACALLCCAPKIAKGKKTARREEGNLFQKLRNKLINYIASKKKFDSNGWVDVSLLQGERFQPIDLRIEDDRVICNASNQVLEVTVVKQKLLQHTDDASFHELTVHSKKVAPNAKLLSRIPLMKMRLHQEQQKQLPGGGTPPTRRAGLPPLHGLPPNFEGYIVCTKKDTDALLVPKTLKSVQFVSGPWKVRVSIDFYRCPLSNFGRIFQVTIIDQVNVLLNNEKSFIWPIPLTSFFEVYDFHLAARDCKKGNFCQLERTTNGDGHNGSLILECPSWGKAHKLTLGNALLLSAYLGMTIAHGLSYPFMNLSADDYISSRYSQISKNSPKIRKRVIKSSYLRDEFEEEESKYSLKKLSLITHLLFLGGAGIANAAYGVKTLVDIIKNLNSINDEFERAVSFYPWELRYPQSYLASQGGAKPKGAPPKEPPTGVKKNAASNGQRGTNHKVATNHKFEGNHKVETNQKVDSNRKVQTNRKVETPHEVDAPQIAQAGGESGGEQTDAPAGVTQQKNNKGENDRQARDPKELPNGNEPSIVKIFEQNIIGN